MVIPGGCGPEVLSEHLPPLDGQTTLGDGMIGCESGRTQRARRRGKEVTV
jgi:hypothetical protein